MGKPVGTDMGEDVPSSFAGTSIVVTPGVVFKARKGNHPTEENRQMTDFINKDTLGPFDVPN